MYNQHEQVLVLFIVFCILQVLDIYTTHRCLQEGGTELNPIAAALFKAVGVLPGAIVAKGILCILMWNSLNLANAQAWLAILDVIYVAVVVNNFSQLK